MVFIKKINYRPSHPAAGISRGGCGCSKPTLNMQNMSQLSSTSSSFDVSLTPEYIRSVPSRIFAFSHRGRPHHRMSASPNDDVFDPQITENMSILNHLNKLITEEANGEMAGIQKRKRNKTKLNNNEEEEFEDLDVINVNGEQIDLKYVASVADGVFESELNKMTAGMVREDEFLGVLNCLDGRWGSRRKRRKYVDAAVFAKVLPVNWAILLSLRPRVRHPSLYCRRFVSPSGVHLNSCKDVAFYLKSQFSTKDANPPKEAAMMQIDNNFQVDIESGSLVPGSSPRASKLDLLETNDLCNVPLYHLIQCQYCNVPFTSMGGLEVHLQKVHGNTIRRWDKDTLTRKLTAPHGLLLIREHKYSPPIIENSVERKTVVIKEVDPLQDTVMSLDELIDFPINGDGSSSFPEPSNEPKKSSEAKGNLKTRCMWCLVEFFREPVEAETLVHSSGFICPKCKEDAAWRFENALSELTRHVGK